MSASTNELGPFRAIDKVGEAAAALPPDEYVLRLSEDNPLLMAKLLQLHGAREFDGEAAARLRQAQDALAEVVHTLEPASHLEDEVRYWINPSVPPPNGDDFDLVARATVKALADVSPLFQLLKEVMPHPRTAEDVATGDYL